MYMNQTDGLRTSNSAVRIGNWGLGIDYYREYDDMPVQLIG
jgi:hypothetical protein